LVNFTREPIIESIITPKEGCKLVVRNSKGVGQEEYFIDSLEIVSFGNALFYRSNERPKSFLLPVTDYEVLEVRDTRLVLKNVSLSPRLNKSDRNIATKDNSGESSLPGSVVEVKQEKRKRRVRRKKDKDETGTQPQEANSGLPEKKEPVSPRTNVKKETSKENANPKENSKKEPSKDTSPPKTVKEATEAKMSTENLRKMLVPPPILISDTISRYKEIDEQMAREKAAAEAADPSLKEKNGTALPESEAKSAIASEEKVEKKEAISSEKEEKAPLKAESDQKATSSLAVEEENATKD
jgi:hypothetical protein